MQLFLIRCLLFRPLCVGVRVDFLFSNEILSILFNHFAEVARDCCFKRIVEFVLLLLIHCSLFIDTPISFWAFLRLVLVLLRIT